MLLLIDSVVVVPEAGALLCVCGVDEDVDVGVDALDAPPDDPPPQADSARDETNNVAIALDSLMTTPPGTSASPMSPDDDN
ncbi:MAG TPA: hypothetical protein VNX02_06220 [Steroidobacteraceae bacterium]|nr:hypothetical protein [Steroidobacteraceae bacterium]